MSIFPSPSTSPWAMPAAVINAPLKSVGENVLAATNDGETTMLSTEAIDECAGGLPTRSKTSVTVVPGVRDEILTVACRPSNVTPEALVIAFPGLTFKNDVALALIVGTTELERASSSETSNASGTPPAG